MSLKLHETLNELDELIDSALHGKSRKRAQKLIVKLRRLEDEVRESALYEAAAVAHSWSHSAETAIHELIDGDEES